MFDQDQSYLLKSYNQNEALFSNIGSSMNNNLNDNLDANFYQQPSIMGRQQPFSHTLMSRINTKQSKMSNWKITQTEQSPIHQIFSNSRTISHNNQRRQQNKQSGKHKQSASCYKHGQACQIAEQCQIQQYISPYEHFPEHEQNYQQQQSTLLYQSISHNSNRIHCSQHNKQDKQEEKQAGIKSTHVNMNMNNFHNLHIQMLDSIYESKLQQDQKTAQKISNRKINYHTKQQSRKGVTENVKNSLFMENSQYNYRIHEKSNKNSSTTKNGTKSRKMSETNTVKEYSNFYNNDMTNDETGQETQIRKRINSESQSRKRKNGEDYNNLFTNAASYNIRLPPNIQKSRTKDNQNNQQENNEQFKYTDRKFKQQPQKQVKWASKVNQRPEKNANVQQIEIQCSKLATKLGYNNQTVAKLEQFINQLCNKYSTLVRKLEQYQHLVDEMQSVINNQAQFIQKISQSWALVGNCHALDRNLSSNKKFNKNQRLFMHEFMESYTKTKSKIVSVINQKITEYQIPSPTNKQKMGLGLNSNTNIGNYNKNGNMKIMTDACTCMDAENMDRHANSRSVPELHQFQSPYCAIKEQTPQAYKQQQQISSPSPANNVNEEANGTEQNEQKQQSSAQQLPISTESPLASILKFRVKQLETQKKLLQSQIHSSSIKIMVIHNENKELREIVQGMIKQMNKLTKCHICHSN